LHPSHEQSHLSHSFFHLFVPSIFYLNNLNLKLFFNQLFEARKREKKREEALSTKSKPVDVKQLITVVITNN
jgi:hypothetical protein